MFVRRISNMSMIHRMVPNIRIKQFERNIYSLPGGPLNKPHHLFNRVNLIVSTFVARGADPVFCFPMIQTNGVCIKRKHINHRGSGKHEIFRFNARDGAG